jgi:dTDP-4-amino-4,6-dideoxygalactose transaminase
MTWEIELTEIPMPEEDVQAVLDCLASGWLTMGPRTERFERAFAQWLGLPHAVAVSSGTAALHLSLLAGGVGQGDEVIVPALTFVATAAAVRFVGAEPVLCDVCAIDDPSIDPEQLTRLLSPRTRAVIAVHFMGYPARIDEIARICEERSLLLVEDAAESVGAIVDEHGGRSGTRGALGAFSFSARSQLVVGEGGMVTSSDEALAARVRSLRSHAMTSGTWDRHRGHADAYDVVDVGFNYRLDEARAALGLSRLTRLDAEIRARRRVVVRYREELGSVPGLELMWDEQAVAKSSHFAFPILLADRRARDAVRAALTSDGVQTSAYPALSELAPYAGVRGAAHVPIAEAAAARHCCLPLSPVLGDERVEIVVDALRRSLPD